MIIPMIFTCARIFIAPFLFQAIMNHAWHIAALLFFIGALTDYCDGFFARYLKQESRLGAALDPVADKIFLTATLYAVSLQVSYIPWFYVACIIVKEVLLIVGAGILLCVIPGFTIKPLWSAKVVTALECVTLCIILVAHIDFIYIPTQFLYYLACVCWFGNVRVFVEYGLKLYVQLKDKHVSS